jgi:hypothetical protein
MRAWTELRALGLLRRIARALEGIEAGEGKKPRRPAVPATMSRPTVEDWNERWQKLQAEKSGR